MSDIFNQRLAAYNAAIATPGVGTAKATLEAATSILAFLSGNEAPAAKTTAAKTKTDAKSAEAETPATANGASPSDAAGFADDGAEITVDAFRAACVKYLEATAKVQGDDKAQELLASHIAPAERISLVPATAFAGILAKFDAPAAATNALFD